MTFNPNTPCVYGLEWRPTREFDGICFGRDDNVIGWWLDSSGTETIAKMWVFVTERLDDSRGFVFEITKEADIASHTVSSATLVPSVTILNSNMVGYGGGGDIATLIDDGPNTWVTSTYTFPSTVVENIPDDTFIQTSDAGQGYASFQFAGIAAAIPATATIVSVDVQYYGMTLLGSSDAQPATLVVPFVVRSDVVYDGASGFMSSVVTQNGNEWIANPATGKPWTRADIVQFEDSSGDTNSIGLRFATTGNVEVFTAVFSMQVVIKYVDPDPRVAIGFFDNRVLEVGWRAVSLQTPTGTPNWAKLTATSYVGLFRKYANDSRKLRLRALGYSADGDISPAPQALHGCTVDFDAAHLLSFAETAPESAMSIILHNGIATASGDSQPYASADGDTEWAAIGADPNSFWSGISANDEGRQYITVGTGGNFQYLRFIARADSNNLPTDPLIVGVYKQSDNSLIYGPFTINPEDLTAPYDVWELIECTAAAAVAIAGGTQVYVKFTSLVLSTASWHVQCLSTLSQLPAAYAPPTNTDTVNFKGTTDTARWRDTTISRPGQDYCVVITTLPSAPTTLTASLVSSGCLSHVYVNWDTTSSVSCGTFGGYEVQRQDRPGRPWQTIARIWDRTLSEFNDYEAPRNVTPTYRVRQIRLDGAPSGWSNQYTLTTYDACCGYVFASNYNATSLWYDSVGRKRETTFKDNVTIIEFEDEDVSAAFRELSDRGDEFKLTLMLANDAGLGGVAAASGVNRGREVFRALLELMGTSRNRNTAVLLSSPYIAVKDEVGSLWYANVRAGNGFRSEPGGDYQLEVTVTEVAREPDITYVGTSPV